MRWDYRLVRRMVDGEERLGIHRAFYADDADEAPQAVSLAPSAVEGTDPAEVLRLMSAALDRPTIEFDSLENQSLLAGFLAAEDHRLVVGLLRKADGMGNYLTQIKEDSPLPPDWPDMDPPDMGKGSYIAYIRKRPEADFLVEFPDLPGCGAHGHSLEQARCQAQQALESYLGEHRKSGEPLPTARGWQDLAIAPERRGATLIVVDPYPEA